MRDSTRSKSVVASLASGLLRHRERLGDMRFVAMKRRRAEAVALAEFQERSLAGYQRLIDFGSPGMLTSCTWHWYYPFPPPPIFGANQQLDV